MEDIATRACLNGPEDLEVSWQNAKVMELHSSKSLFRLKTYLEGVIDMYNATFLTRRVVWLQVTRNKLNLEEIEV